MNILSRNTHQLRSNGTKNKWEQIKINKSNMKIMKKFITNRNKQRFEILRKSNMTCYWKLEQRIDILGIVHDKPKRYNIMKIFYEKNHRVVVMTD